MGFIPSSNYTSSKVNTTDTPAFTSSSSISSSSSSKRKFECPVSALNLRERASTIHKLCFPILSGKNHKAPCRIMFHILKDWLRHSKENIHNKSNELTQLVSERLRQFPRGDLARFELVESIVKSETHQRIIIKQRCLSPNDTQFKPIKTIDLTTGEKCVIHEELSATNSRQSVGIKVELNGNGIDSFQTHLKSLAEKEGVRIFELGVYKNTEAHSAMILYDEENPFIVDLTTHQGVFSDITDYLEAKNKDFENSENSLILNILPENSFVEPPIKKITKVKSETPIQSEFKILEGNDSNIITKLLNLPENESINKLWLGSKVTCSEGTLKQIAQNMNGLRVLVLGNNVTCSDDTLKQIAQNMNGLNMLALGNNVTCSDDTLKKIAQNMNGLRALFLGNNVTCSDGTLKKIAQKMNGLRALILGNNVTCSDGTLKKIAQKMNGLKILSLGDNVICSNQIAHKIKKRCVENIYFYTTPNTTISESSKKLLSS